MKRGMSCQEAMDYVGVKRRTFDELWRPNLVALKQGVCTVFDRHDLDELFDKFKRETTDTTTKENKTWERSPAEFTRKKTEPGALTNAATGLDFSREASKILRKQKGGC